MHASRPSSGEESVRGRWLAWCGRSPVREIAATVAVLAAGLAWRHVASLESAAAAPSPTAGANAPTSPGPSTSAPAQPSIPATAAMVNGAEIPREQLVAECLARHGNSVLETLVNQRLIEQACGRAGIVVTRGDVDAEIASMAGRFQVPVDKWIEMIGKERGITEAQYRREIVWPMLALRQLAHAQSEPAEEEIAREFERQFGDAVKARIIVARTQKDAEAMRAQAIAAPDDFGGLARRHSVDVTSASANGWVQPIRRHTGVAEFEAAAFALSEGQISPVVQVADQFIVIKCEGRLPAAGVSLADVRDEITSVIREQKSREVSGEVFRGLQQASRIEKVFGDPQQQAARAGLAAVVNGDAISMETLASTCLERHGLEVIEILITRSLIGQALDRQRLNVTQEDIDREIAHGARTLGFLQDDGTPDVKAWLTHITTTQEVPMQHYLEDIVRPTVALKKLVGPATITQEDLDKAFQATFGPRARCRMIVLDTQRRAQEVWQMARENPTPEFFGDLAERYSVDQATQALRGEVPPIQRYSGQPALEREAFSLSAGELSGVVQVADRFIIMFSEGFTEPVDVRFDEVREELEQDIQDKKQRIAMAEYFTRLRQGAAIDNFVAGTSQTPAGGPGLGGVPPGVARAEQDELARPRAGSRIPARPSPPAGNPGGVVPASAELPLRR
jgi:parvulin-like peptidyl-prolyl isomerase